MSAVANCYLTRDELDLIIAGLSESLRKHYYDSDSIPTLIIDLTAKLQIRRNEFIRCEKCGKIYNKEYSWTVCCEEEE